MKLSDYAKQMDVRYEAAWRWFRDGKIQGGASGCTRPSLLKAKRSQRPRHRSMWRFMRELAAKESADATG